MEELADKEFAFQNVQGAQALSSNILVLRGDGNGIAPNVSIIKKAYIDDLQILINDAGKTNIGQYFGLRFRINKINSSWSNIFKFNLVYESSATFSIGNAYLRAYDKESTNQMPVSFTKGRHQVELIHIFNISSDDIINVDFLITEGLCDNIMPKPGELIIKSFTYEIVPYSEITDQKTFKEYCRFRAAIDYSLLIKKTLKDFQSLELETILLPKLTSNSGVSIDIGANQGFWSILLSPLSDKVYAFEANPEIFVTLALNTAPYSNIQQFCIAISNKINKETFNIPQFGESIIACSGSGGLYSELMEKMGISLKKKEVITIPLDILNLDKVSFIKIDVEGSEFDTLIGAVETIKRCSPNIVAEIEYRHNKNCEEIFKFFHSLNYAAFYINKRSRTIKKLSSFNLNKMQLNSCDESHQVINPIDYINNFIFIHKTKIALIDEITDLSV